MTTPESDFRFTRPAPAATPPTSPWSLEASAGTGKTWNIANFVVDYLADGSVTPDEVVMVTFTRSAAAELRSRVRQNIANIVDKKFPEGIEYDDTEREHLRRALADFGHMRISTIHGFAQRLLAQLGEPLGEISSEVDSDAFRESVISDVVRSLPQDQLDRLFVSLPREDKELKWTKKLEELLEVVSNHPDGYLFASATVNSPETYWPFLLDIAGQVRDAFAARKAQLGVAGYSDILLRLRDRLRDPDAARSAAASIRVLLIDEFQDTDSLQWDIFQLILDQADENFRACVVVGDPKQAIYSFRGGDVQLYREVVAPDSFSSLRGNQRSTKSFVDGANLFFEGVSFGPDMERTFGEEPPAGCEVDTSGALEVGTFGRIRSADIRYEEIEARGLLRAIDDVPGWVFRPVGGAKADDIRNNVRDDLPGYIARLCNHEEIPDADTQELRKVSFGDICILGNSNNDIKKWSDALEAAHIPTTIIGTDSVLGSTAALQWRFLLEALLRPQRISSARLLAHSWFGGQDIDTVARHRDDPVWLATFSEKLVSWRTTFASGRRHEFFDDVIRESQVLTFLAEKEHADRTITDVLHVGEILRQRPSDTLSELIEVLEEEDATAKRALGDDTESVASVWSRRIDGDRPSVRLMTIHQAKGLQFPIVLLPYLTEGATSRKGVLGYRMEVNGAPLTVIDLSAPSQYLGGKVKSALQGAENSRKAYVALTRARLRNIIWSFETARTKVAIRHRSWHQEAVRNNPSLFIEDDRPGETIEPERVEREATLAVATRHLPAPATQTSYSRLDKRLHKRSGEDPGDGDFEPDSRDASATPAEPAYGGSYRKGNEARVFGKVLHRVLQDDLPAATDDALRQRLHKAAAEFGFSIAGDAQRERGAIEMLTNALTGDLGAFASNLRLADFDQSRRLSELDFAFNIPDAITTTDVLTVLKKHLADDPDYADWLRHLEGTSLEVRGLLTGAIDAVLAVADPAQPTFYVADYKSNNLGQSDNAGYSRAVMQHAMDAHNYQLQALIYLVALHRFLRGRLLDAYDYDTHVGGAAYLFLRGMRRDVAGAGVYTLRPPKACIEDLSDVFEGRLS